MFDKIFKFPVHGYLHVLGLCILAFGLPMNKVLMSIGGIWGISNLLLEGKFKMYWNNIRATKVYWWLGGLVLLHFIGLIYSDNLSYGLHDLRIKLPLITVPLVLAARPLKSTINYDLILMSFLTSISITSFINIAYYFDWIGTTDIYKFREISKFGSHIRYGLLIVIAATISLYFILKLKKYRPFFFVLLCWFTYYTFTAQVLSAFIAYICVFIVLGSLYIKKKFSKTTIWIACIVIIISVTIVSIQLVSFLNPENPKVIFIEKTAQGNPYISFVDNFEVENGNYVFHNFNNDELARAWKEKTSLNLDLSSMQYQVLLRYLTSKGLMKDYNGCIALTKADILNVQNGIANYKEVGGGLTSRLYTLRTEFQKRNNPNYCGSLIRVSYWEIGIQIIKENLLFGVGTGDVQDKFTEKLITNKTFKEDQLMLHSHQQFITFWVSFGIIGFIIFTVALIVFMKQQYNQFNCVGIGFGITFIVSCFTEDTLETQMGVNLFCLFWAIHQSKIKHSEALRLRNWKALFLFPKIK
jgi:hypothetical protein